MVDDDKRIVSILFIGDRSAEALGDSAFISQIWL